MYRKYYVIIKSVNLDNPDKLLINVLTLQIFALKNIHVKTIVTCQVNMPDGGSLLFMPEGTSL